MVRLGRIRLTCRAIILCAVVFGCKLWRVYILEPRIGRAIGMVSGVLPSEATPRLSFQVCRLGCLVVSVLNVVRRLPVNGLFAVCTNIGIGIMLVQKRRLLR